MAISNKVWTSKSVADAVTAIEEGRDIDTSCFWSNDPQYRAPNINFELSELELKEFIKCSRDVVHFADKYCYAMTDEGIANIDLRPYQREMLKIFNDKRFVVMLASRQIGKCFIFNTLVIIKYKDSGKIATIPIYKLWDMVIRPNLSNLPLKQRVIYKIKYALYKTYDRIDHLSSGKN